VAVTPSELRANLYRLFTEDRTIRTHLPSARW
jgi:hypothetical protein